MQLINGNVILTAGTVQFLDGPLCRTDTGSEASASCMFHLTIQNCLQKSI